MLSESVQHKSGKDLRVTLMQQRAKPVHRTALTASEAQLATQMWNNEMGRRETLDSLEELYELLDRLQLPMQPMIRTTVDNAYAAASREFGLPEFKGVLEQCKTLHARWQLKVRGKSFDDDLLEAFIAVGGQPDSTGAIDMEVLQSIMEEFNLEVPTTTDSDDGSKGFPSKTPGQSFRGNASGNAQSFRSMTSPTDTGLPPKLAFTDFVRMLRDTEKANFSSATYVQTVDDLDRDPNAPRRGADDGAASTNPQKQSFLARMMAGSVNPGSGGAGNAEADGRRKSVLPPIAGQQPVDDGFPPRSKSTLPTLGRPAPEEEKKARAAARLPALQYRPRDKRRHRFANGPED